MEHAVHSVHSAPTHHGISDAAGNEPNLIADYSEVLQPPSGQVVQHDHAVASGDECLDEVRADEAGCPA